MSRSEHKVERLDLDAKPAHTGRAVDVARLTALLAELGALDAAEIMRAPAEGFPYGAWSGMPGVAELLRDPKAYLGTAREIGMASEDPRAAFGTLALAALAAKNIEHSVMTAREISDEVLRGMAVLKTIKSSVEPFSARDEKELKRSAKVCEHVLTNLEDRVLSRCMKLKPREEISLVAPAGAPEGRKH